MILFRGGENDVRAVELVYTSANHADYLNSRFAGRAGQNNYTKAKWQGVSMADNDPG